MKTYILLLRGINVGGKTSLPMQALAALLEKNGCKNIRTYIQSGNAVLHSTKNPGTSISAAIASKFGFRPEVVVLEKSELETALTNNPFRSREGKCVHFYFAARDLRPDREKLERYASDTERYEIKGRVFYLHAPDGIGRSKLVANIDGCLGVPVTGRNLNTITRLKQLSDQ